MIFVVYLKGNVDEQEKPFSYMLLYLTARPIPLFEILTSANCSKYSKLNSPLRLDAWQFLEFLLNRGLFHRIILQDS